MISPNTSSGSFSTRPLADGNPVNDRTDLASRDGDPAVPGHSRPTLHHFTVDVEEYFQVAALEPYIHRAGWDGFESRVAVGVSRLLDVLNRYGARGTFFVLGWIAERHPQVVHSIVEAGHEVASHGWDHRRVTRLTRTEFRRSVGKTKSLLEDLTGRPVIGFRAPSFSIVPGLEWAIDILVEEGYRYDSSLFPINRRGYGYPSAPRDPHWIEFEGNGGLIEVPPATLRRWGKNLPAGGGAYFRLLPYRLIRAAVCDYERRRVPATFYIHPWELDPKQPRLPLISWRTRVRHYGGLDRTLQRLERLLSEFRFTAVGDRWLAAADREPQVKPVTLEPVERAGDSGPALVSSESGARRSAL